MSIHKLILFAKGAIGPEAIQVGGTLQPEAANRLISMVFEDPFMALVTTERMRRLKKDVDVFDIASRQLVRVAEGSEPAAAELAELTEFGCTLNALDVQLFVTLKRSFILDNQDTSDFVGQIENAFAAKLRNEFIDLGFNGTLDNNTSGFLTLNKGWLQVAKDSANTKKVDIDIATNKVKATLQSLLDAADNRFKETSAFIMSTTNADSYAAEVASTEGIRVDVERARRYLKYDIISNRHCPDDQILFTPPRNLVFGMVSDIERSREYHTRKRAVEYTWNVWVDYEIAVKQACVIGRPTPV